jgi:transposase-like protein
MIRLFTALCKSVLEQLSDEAIFQEATDGFRYHNERCPSCGAEGKLSPYSDYFRYLVSHDGEKIIVFRVRPLRFECMSCTKTHALLPDIIIPYSPYSLRFMLTVLVAYFERSTTVQAVCSYYGIAVSTFYAWKHRLLEHKELLLGMLASLTEPVQEFLRGLLISIRISEQLSNFFHRYGFSFMQNRTEGFAKLSTAATRSQPP